MKYLLVVSPAVRRERICIPRHQSYTSMHGVPPVFFFTPLLFFFLEDGAPSDLVGGGAAGMWRPLNDRSEGRGGDTAGVVRNDRLQQLP